MHECPCCQIYEDLAVAHFILDDVLGQLLDIIDDNELEDDDPIIVMAEEIDGYLEQFEDEDDADEQVEC